MSVTVNFYTFSKRDNSTKRPTGNGTSLNCEMRYECSILRPVLQVTSPISNPKLLNYAYISDWGRYYWVTDWSYETGFWYVRLQVDVLASFKTEIGSSNLYVLRSASQSDGTIRDTIYPAKMQKDSDIVTETTHWIYPAGGTFVFGIQNGGANTAKFGATTYYIMDYFEARDFMNEVFNINSQTYESNIVQQVANLPDALYKSLINPQQYIVSCLYLPFDPETLGGTSTSTIKLGWYEYNGSAFIFNPNYNTLPTITFNMNVPKHPQAPSRGVYLNGDPYTDYELEIPPFGVVSLPTDNMLTASQISINIIVDVVTGLGTLQVFAGSQLLDRRESQVGVNISIAGGSQDLTGGAQSGAGLFAGISKIASGGGPVSVLATLGSLASAIESASPKIGSQGSNGGLSFLEYDYKLYARFFRIVDEDNTHQGRPLCQMKTINTLSGYMIIADGDIECDATYSESNAIKSFLESGFYYE